MLRAFICLAWFLSHSILRISLWCRYYCYSPYYIGASLVAHRVKNLPAMQETWFNPCVGKIPWGRGWLPIPVFLPGEFPGRRILAGCSSWGCKKQLALSLSIINNVEHLFFGLLAVCVSSLERCWFRASAQFLIGLSVFLILSSMSCLRRIANI